MTTLNFKIIAIGLLSLLLISVAEAKCYPGLDCPEDLPNANNTPNVPTPEPSNNQQTQTQTQIPEPVEEPPIADEPQTTGKIIGHKIPNVSNDTSEEEVPTLSKYGKYPTPPSKYKKYK